MSAQKVIHPSKAMEASISDSDSDRDVTDSDTDSTNSDHSDSGFPDIKKPHHQSKKAKPAKKQVNVSKFFDMQSTEFNWRKCAIAVVLGGILAFALTRHAMYGLAATIALPVALVLLDILYVNTQSKAFKELDQDGSGTIEINEVLDFSTKLMSGNGNYAQVITLCSIAGSYLFSKTACWGVAAGLIIVHLAFKNEVLLINKEQLSKYVEYLDFNGDGEVDEKDFVIGRFELLTLVLVTAAGMFYLMPTEEALLSAVGAK